MTHRPGRRERVVGLEAGERVLEARRGPRRSARGGLGDRDPRGDDAMVERRHDHRDAVVADDPEARHDVLLDRRGRPAASGREPAEQRPEQARRVERGRGQRRR